MAAAFAVAASAALRRGGLRLARSAVAVKYVQEGIRRGAFRLAVMVATKPGGGVGNGAPAAAAAADVAGRAVQ